MQPAINPNNDIQQLIQVNYQRMMAFEQAAYLSSGESFKSFFSERADESEAHLKELYAYLNLSEAEGEDFATRGNAIAENKLFQIITGKKNPVSILNSVKLIEKTISGWYKGIISEIKSFPEELGELVNRQYQALAKSQLQLQVL